MANEEHLAILKKGVKFWNKWREEHPEARPDLREADLKGEDLRGINLHNAILDRVNLVHANCHGLDLGSASLARAKVREADLGEANLGRTYLASADLRGANLNRADLGASDLQDADLTDTNLHEANIGEANLRNADLRGADLSGSDLWRANLIDSDLDNATLSGAKLWEAQRSGWSIRGVICDSAYWDREAKVSTKYEPGEFERLHSEKPLITLQYAGGITPIEIATLPGMIAKLASEHPGCFLRLKSIKQAPSGATVEIAVDELGGVDLEILKLDNERMQASQREMLGKMDFLVAQFGAANTKLIEAISENARKIDSISPSFSEIKQMLEVLVKSNRLSDEKIHEIAKYVAQMPTESQTSILDFFTHLAGGTWTAVLLKAIELFATR